MLTTAAKARINGANARCLSRITGRTAHQEASARGQTYNLVGSIQQRKWKWLGHILRMPGDRLVKLALKVQFEKKERLNMLEGIPAVETFEELTAIAHDRERWKDLQPYVAPPRSGLHGHTTTPNHITPNTSHHN